MNALADPGVLASLAALAFAAGFAFGIAVARASNARSKRARVSDTSDTDPRE